MYIPFTAISKGYRAVFESEALAFDRVSERSSEEFKRKVRTLAGNYQIFAHFPELLNPLKSPIGWQLISHKLLRLSVPFFLLVVFVSNLFLLAEPFYVFTLVAQLVFYGLAGYEALRVRTEVLYKGIGYLPYMFCLLNYSAVMGLIRFLKGEQKVTWERAYV